MGQISVKEATRGADLVFRTGYGDLQNLLRYSNRYGYNAGMYGWNCDVFNFYKNGKYIVITTGYRNLRGERIPSDIVKKYEDEARSVLEYGGANYESSYGAREPKILDILGRFLSELCEL